MYRARDARLGREVAIKVLPASFSADPDRLRRFEQEARAAGILNHPNITAVYDIGSDEAGEPYVVSELLEGETLRAALAGGRLPARRAVDYAVQIAHGLSAAHEKGIVHRDLKPENLFVTKDGRVKILDFGLAKLTHQEEGSQVTNLPTATAGTEPGVVLGTLGYMSPEQVRGRPADARSDIFSFGAILYEMLSGNRAFRGDSAADTMSAILKEDPPELSLTNQNVSPGLERVIRHCLEKNPEQRFHSAHDLAFDLQALSGTSGASKALIARRGSFARAARIAAAALLLCLAGAAAGYYFRHPSSAREAVRPKFHRLTFRRGFIDSAKFAPDGQTIVYSAAWDGKQPEIFSTRVGASESRPLSLPNAGIYAISSTGEMAIDLIRPYGVPDVLARVALAGGVPREVAEDALSADWSADGKSLGMIRAALSGHRTLEFPAGKVLYRSPFLVRMKVSPVGREIAVAEWSEDEGSISIFDLEGHRQKILSHATLGGGIGWRPDGSEIWYSAAPDPPPNIYGVDRRGKTRLVLASPGWLVLHDVAADGRVLLSQDGWRGGLQWQVPGQDTEKEASWLDWSIPNALSPDGKTLLFSEGREAAGPEGAIFLRRSPEEVPVRLGDGEGLALSPDGRSVLGRLRGIGGKPQRLMVLPTGTGDQKIVPTGSLSEFQKAEWLPDGKRVILRGSETAKGSRLYLVDLARGPLRAISEEGASRGVAVSPDGTRVACRIGGSIRLISVEGSDVSMLPGQAPGESPIQWSAEGAALYVFRPGPPPVEVFRIEAATGERKLWKRLAPPDAAGARFLSTVLLTPDTSGYVYGYERRWSDLYAVEGLK